MMNKDVPNLNQPLFFKYLVRNIYFIFKLYKYINICIISAQKLNVFKHPLEMMLLILIKEKYSFIFNTYLSLSGLAHDVIEQIIQPDK